jgi:hypothetical protein
MGSRLLDRLVERENAQLLAVYADYTNLAGADLAVNPDLRVSGER